MAWQGLNFHVLCSGREQNLAVGGGVGRGSGGAMLVAVGAGRLHEGEVGEAEGKAATWTFPRLLTPLPSCSTAFSVVVVGQGMNLRQPCDN